MRVWWRWHFGIFALLFLGFVVIELVDAAHCAGFKRGLSLFCAGVAACFAAHAATYWRRSR